MVEIKVGDDGGEKTVTLEKNESLFGNPKKVGIYVAILELQQVLNVIINRQDELDKKVEELRKHFR